MINFLIVLFIVFIKQVLFMAAFCLGVYYGDWYFIIITALLIIYLIFHFIYTKKICNKLNLSKILYNIYGCICWLLGCEIITSIIYSDWFWKFAPIAKNNPLSAALYIFAPLFLIIYIIILGVLELIVFITKKLSKKNK